MLRAKIVGTGSYLPKKILTNADFEKIVDTSDEWITTRTGIKQRHIAEENETTTDMGYNAAKDAIADAHLEPEDIDTILFATVTPDMSFPSCSCQLQNRLMTKNGMSLDFSAACSGFIYGLHLANSLISTESSKNVLLISAEKLSSIVDYTDRNTCVLFGDAAGAAVLSPTNDDTGILSTFLGSDGSKGALLNKEAGGSKNPFSKMKMFDYRKMYMYMEGRVIFKSAIQRMTESLDEVVKKAGKNLGDIDMIIPHQANTRIIDMVREHAKLREDQVYVNLPNIGNTSASTIPVALDEARKNGRLKQGDLLGVTAFGGGLTYGAALIQM